MKKIILLISCFFTIIYLYILYNRVSYNNKISENNQEFIKTQVFSKDSENRGYSDEVKSLMEEDLKQVDNDQDVTKLYMMMNKSLRILTLSKNETEYYNNFIRYTQLSQCLSSFMISKNNKIEKVNFIDAPSIEELNMNKVIDFLDYKYTKNYTMKENQIMMKNAEINEKICKDFVNEK